MLIKTPEARLIETSGDGQGDEGFFDGGNGISGHYRKGEEQSRQQRRSEHPEHWKRSSECRWVDKQDYML